MKKKLFFSLSLISHIGVATALPLLVLALGGRHLDHAYNSSPKFFIVGVATATFITFYTLRSITSKAIKTLSGESE
jgi:hypothetical protein